MPVSPVLATRSSGSSRADLAFALRFALDGSTLTNGRN
jgi:hypothetical protein